VPFLVVPLVLIAVVLALVVLIPLSLVQRYRVGTRRQPVRGWLATANTVAFAVSTLFFVASAAVTDIWVPHPFTHTLIGLLAGCILGLFGLALTLGPPAPRGREPEAQTSRSALVAPFVAEVGRDLVRAC
jgi:hypothetical protein